MNSYLREVLDEFNETLKEVEILISSAEIKLNEGKSYTTYIKSAILLLSGKFENFIELMAETYIYQLNNNNLLAKKIPESIKLRHSFGVIEKIQNSKCSGEEESIKKFSELGSIWVLTDQPINNLQIDCKFSYGKHGEAELVKLFSNIGIQNVFEQIKVTIPDEVDPNNQKIIDFKGTFNTLTFMRNNILHQNASPNLTHIDVSTNLQIIQAFSLALANYLDNSLSILITY